MTLEHTLPDGTVVKVVPESDLMASYVAGIVDGEGSIYLKHHCTNQSGRPTFQLNVVISNTYLLMLELIQSIFGGRLYSCNKFPHGGRKRIHELIWTGNNAEDLLMWLYPYLIVKSRQAELALEFQEIIHSKEGDRARVLSEAELVVRNYYRETISGLNKGG